MYCAWLQTQTYLPQQYHCNSVNSDCCTWRNDGNVQKRKAEKIAIGLIKRKCEFMESSLSLIPKERDTLVFQKAIQELDYTSFTFITFVRRLTTMASSRYPLNSIIAFSSLETCQLACRTLIRLPRLRLNDENSTGAQEVFHSPKELFKELIPFMHMDPLRDTHAHDGVIIAILELAAQQNPYHWCEQERLRSGVVPSILGIT